MKIRDALRTENIRVENGYRWMCGDGWHFIVYERKYNAKKTTTLIETKDEDKAVDVLLGKE